ncbi:MAG: redoxin domain-containing protein [Opitutales bacterium]
MKKLLLLLSSCLLVLSLSARVDNGSPAPGFTLPDSTGVEHSLSDFEGSYVVLEWTNHQCPFVKKFYAEGHMQALQEEMTGEGVVWLQVLSSAPGKQGYLDAVEAEALRSENRHHSTAMLLDPSGVVGKRYDARTTPHMYLIDPEGMLIYQGAIDSIKSTRTSDISEATNYVEAAFEAHRKGDPVAKPVTTPYGCSVKY